MFGDIVVSPCLLCDRLVAKKYHNSLQTVVPGLLEGRGRDCGFSVTELQHNMEDPGCGLKRHIQAGEADVEGCGSTGQSPRRAMIPYV
jgi:hypothetical protein